MMTRKHFKEIAEILRVHQSGESIVKGFADFCAKNNPNFDYDKFYEACEWW